MSSTKYRPANRSWWFRLNATNQQSFKGHLRQSLGVQTSTGFDVEWFRVYYQPQLKVPKVGSSFHVLPRKAGYSSGALTRVQIDSDSISDTQRLFSTTTETIMSVMKGNACCWCFQTDVNLSTGECCNDRIFLGPFAGLSVHMFECVRLLHWLCIEFI